MFEKNQEVIVVNVSQTAHERRLERSVMYRLDYNLTNTVHSTKEFMKKSYERIVDGKKETEEEIHIILLLRGKKTAKFNTGEHNYKAAKKDVEYAINFAESENLGEPIAWKYEGENVYRSLRDFEKPLVKFGKKAISNINQKVGTLFSL